MALGVFSDQGKTRGPPPWGVSTFHASGQTKGKQKGKAKEPSHKQDRPARGTSPHSQSASNRRHPKTRRPKPRTRRKATLFLLGSWVGARLHYYVRLTYCSRLFCPTCWHKNSVTKNSIFCIGVVRPSCYIAHSASLGVCVESPKKSTFQPESRRSADFHFISP